MRQSLKPIIQDILQMSLDGKLKSPEDMFPVIERHQGEREMPFEELIELTEYCVRVVRCDNIPAAKAFAEKYSLTIVLT